MKVKSEHEVAQSYLTLRNPMDCSLPDSSVHGMFPGKSTGVGCHCLLWYVFIEPFKFSFFSITGRGIDLDYHDIEWFTLETNGDHSVVFEIASKYCFPDSFVDYDGYSISFNGFVPTTVDTMVI